MSLARIFLCAAALSALVIWALLRSGLAWKIAMDRPNERSLHRKPVPRVGGLGIAAVVLFALLLSLLFPVSTSGSGAVLSMPTASENARLALICALALGLASISLADDRYGLPVAWRFGAHLAAAIGLVAVAADRDWGWIALAALALAAVWAINLYNFMDGMDGLAGGMALCGFGALALSGFWNAQPGAETGAASLAAAIAGAAFGFLWFNWHPARVFMGDCGSVALGFLAAALGLLGARDGLWPLWLPVWIFLPFVADASATLAGRLVRGERVWQAHREHYYQRMVRMGWGHRRTALICYLAMIVSAATGCAAVRASNPVAAVLAVAVIVLHLGLGWFIDRRWARFEREK